MPATSAPMERGLGRLPRNFLFGVATADHQCEAYDPAYPPDVWDWWEQRGAVPQPRGWAADFWRRYPQYVELARNLGCNAFRFSISWARVEPEPGRFDDGALRHYADLAAEIRRQEMEPIVTLCHYVWPLHLEQAGGLIGPEFPKRFQAYATRVREVLGSNVRYWLTFNEANVLVASHSRFNLRFAPGAPLWRDLPDQIEDMELLVKNVFLAHRLAREALHEVPHPRGTLVSLNSDVRGYPIGMRQLINRLVMQKILWESRGARTARRLTARLAGPLTTVLPGSAIARLLLSGSVLFEGDWAELGALGKLPAYLCPDDCSEQLDYLAFDFYYAVRSIWEIGRLSASFGGAFERAPVYPQGLYDVLVYFDGLFRRNGQARKPILIAENGLVDQRKALKERGENVPAEASAPAQSIPAHVAEVCRAVAAGVNVIGYLVWSITSNREWGLRFAPTNDFGLFRLDLDNDPALRHPELPLHPERTPAADAYQNLIAAWRRGA
jgi:beta-glucosidase/6-phospho-beta-glucosidase/beta-galactosidase